METRIFESKESVAKAFCEYLVKLIASKPTVHIALSGGSTPKIVFNELAAHYSHQIDWNKVFLYWGDERCVEPTDSESNYKMTRDHLLSKVRIPEVNIFRIQGENNPESEAVRYGRVLDEQLSMVGGLPQFDLVILGMGDDGHTASIFPDSIAKWDAPSNCVAVAHPVSGQIRVSLTGRIINHAKEVAFLVTGIGKAEKVQEILQNQPSAKAYPASLVQPESGKLIWFLDQEAASLL
ncbi:6-phosphogluconolactonase [Algoriphagus kandeliae]|uniref:6-phosphogluconolactonase n=1 Tax=Algoriphagus kandeliae TaxID=2562278 RepID=A0A4Y9QV72_9BACT|nr:6-phosphogluconolactonase [Algoriphagus kandeliae]TFV95638.1 6-phosphogluconolactonase [Algoriphagus kandeliae]